LAPELSVITSSGPKNLLNYKGKYLYLHFFDPNSEKSTIELPILEKIHRQYANYVTFLSICRASSINADTQQIIDKLPWETAILADANLHILQHYKVGTFPYYVLIDSHSYIVQAPALGPQPDNRYRTIHEVFSALQQAIESVDK